MVNYAYTTVACEQAHSVVCYSREYLAAEVGEWSRKKNGARKSEPAQKPLNFEFRLCEVTSLNCQGIKFLTNTSEAKSGEQTRQQIFTLEWFEFFMNVPEYRKRKL